MSPDFNAAEKAELLIADLKARSEHYLTDEIFVVFGDDFQYKDAEQNYRNLDAIIDYMNNHHAERYIFRYSTPSEYVDALAKLDVKWPTKYDDMFPYSDSPNSFWTGFYTSRPNLKDYIRTASRNFHASSQLYSLKALQLSLDESEFNRVMSAHLVMLDRIGIVQHHDAVTGTSKQRVANDYSYKLSTGLSQNNEQYSKLIGQKVK